MQITNFQISEDRSQIDLTIIDATNVSSLRFWSNVTYKDYSDAIDLSSKLTASATETITITLSDVGLVYFDGVYFLEAEDVSEISESITGDLTRYKECILNKLAEYSVCEECLQKENNSLLNAHALLTGLEDAIEVGFINEILLFINALDKYCSAECLTCGDRNNVVNTNYYSTND